MSNRKTQEFGNQTIEPMELGVPAELVDINSLLNHQKPNQIRDEIPTLNQFGYMKFEFEKFSKTFVDLAAKAQKPVLEIGPAYGWLTHRALEKGARVVAVDISKQHLEILLKDTSPNYVPNLYVYQGAFPDEVDFLEESFDAIFMSRVLHFLDANEIEKGLDKIHKWLAPEGKFIATNCSIYHSCVKEQMSETFQHRIKTGEKWPGRVYNQKGIAPAYFSHAPDFLNVFHEDQLKKLLPEHGFQIEEISSFDYPNEGWDDDSKGHIGFIVTKT